MLYTRRANLKQNALWVVGGLAMLLLFGLALLVMLGRLEAADATSTTFSPTSVTLASVGDSATITVQATGVDPTTNGVQINIQHPTSVSVTSPACAGIFGGGVTTGPSAVTGGDLIGCFFFSGGVSGASGGLMTFVLTRVAPGDGVLSLGVGGGFGTSYSSSGTTVGGPGATNTLTFVSAPPQPPVITTVSTTPASPKEGDAVNLAATFTDPNAGDTHTAAITWGDGSSFTAGAVSETAHTITGSHVFMDNGSYTPTLKLVDSASLSATTSTLVAVSNVAPVVNAGLDKAIVEGGTFTSSGSFTDPGADTWTATVNYGDGSGAAALSLNPDKTFALSHLYAQSGTFTVTVTVTDDDGGAGSDTALVTVGNVAPAVNTGPDKTIVEGGTFTSSGSFTDPGADTWTAAVNYGDGSGAAALALDADKTFVLSHMYTKSGTFTITATVTDSDGASGSDAALVTVGNVVPVVNGGPDATISEGSTFSSAGAFTDPGAETWTATVNYGDGSGVTALALSGKTFALSHLYKDNGSYTVTVTVTDSVAGAGSDTVVVTVSNVAPIVDAGPDVHVKLGGSVSLPPATFADPGVLDTHTATINWGDGSGAVAGTVNESAHTVSGSHTYAVGGLFTATVTVTDKDGGSGSDTVKVSAGNEPPTIASLASAQQTTEGALLDLQLATFADTDAGDTHTASIAWGDGSPASAGVVNETSKTIRGNHVYADNGVYTVTVMVSDGGSSASGSFTVTVANAAPSVTPATPGPAKEGGSVTLTASFNDPGTLDTHTATINWGDGSPSVTAIVTESPFGPPGSVSGLNGALSSVHVYAGNGQFRISVCVKDDDGATGCGATSVTVSNVAPVVAGSGVEFGTVEGSAFTLGPVSFADPGADTHTVSVDWGDGSPPSGGSVNEAKHTASATHVYADKGVYKATLTVVDDDGGAGSATFTVKVSNAAPKVSALFVPRQLVGFPFSAPLATVDDPGVRDTQQAFIDWGDGTSSRGSVYAGVVIGSHRYLKEGAYTVTVTAVDKDGGVGKDTLTILVVSMAPIQRR